MASVADFLFPRHGSSAGVPGHATNPPNHLVAEELPKAPHSGSRSQELVALLWNTPTTHRAYARIYLASNAGKTGSISTRSCKAVILILACLMTQQILILTVIGRDSHNMVSGVNCMTERSKFCASIIRLANFCKSNWLASLITDK